MVESENSSDNYSTLKISIGAIIKNSELLKIVPDQLKTKKMCKNAVKKSKFVMYVFDQYKRQQKCDKVILENCRLLRFISDCYRKLYRAPGNCRHAL